MTNQDPNLTRALAILATEPEAAEIKCYGNMISVAGQHLYLDDDDDRAVLSILMADKEFWHAAIYLELAVRELRAMRMVWIDAANKLESEVAA